MSALARALGRSGSGHEAGNTGEKTPPFRVISTAAETGPEADHRDIPVIEPAPASLPPAQATFDAAWRQAAGAGLPDGSALRSALTGGLLTGAIVSRVASGGEQPRFVARLCGEAAASWLARRGVPRGGVPEDIETDMRKAVTRQTPVYGPDSGLPAVYPMAAIAGGPADTVVVFVSSRRSLADRLRHKLGLG